MKKYLPAYKAVRIYYLMFRNIWKSPFNSCAQIIINTVYLIIQTSVKSYLYLRNDKFKSAKNVQ